MFNYHGLKNVEFQSSFSIEFLYDLFKIDKFFEDIDVNNTNY
jgi:hypothetical protein